MVLYVDWTAVAEFAVVLLLLVAPVGCSFRCPGSRGTAQVDRRERFTLCGGEGEVM